MTNDQIAGLFLQGGIGAAALGVLGKIALKVADRMISAIDALSKEARDTGKATVDALSSLAERLSRLEGKVEILGNGDQARVETGPIHRIEQQQWPEDETSEVRRVRVNVRTSPTDDTGYGPLRPTPSKPRR